MRIACQMGAIQDVTFQSDKIIPIDNKQSNNIRLDTSIIGVHKFLNNFFNYYACNSFNYLDYYKDDFLRLINMPYGYQPSKRLSFIQGY